MLASFQLEIDPGSSGDRMARREVTPSPPGARPRPLRQLAERLAAVVSQAGGGLEPGSPISYAHGELSRLDELIARRQQATMGHGVVQLATLRRESEVFARCDAHLAPIVMAAERAPTAAAQVRPGRRMPHRE